MAKYFTYSHSGKYSDMCVIKCDTDIQASLMREWFKHEKNFFKSAVLRESDNLDWVKSESELDKRYRMLCDPDYKAPNYEPISYHEFMKGRV